MIEIQVLLLGLTNNKTYAHEYKFDKVEMRAETDGYVIHSEETFISETCVNYGYRHHSDALGNPDIHGFVVPKSVLHIFRRKSVVSSPNENEGGVQSNEGKREASQSVGSKEESGVALSEDSDIASLLKGVGGLTLDSLDKEQEF